MTVLINRYKLMQQLGQNPGRQTWLAQDLQTEQSVVVKLLTFNSDMRWSDFKLFEREAQLLKSLEHSAIPQYLNYLDLEEPEQQGFALVQEYIPAQSLQQHMKSGRVFTQSDVEIIARKLLNILIYLHDFRPPVIHRDIKPSNILLGDRSGNSPGNVYLIDFDSVQTFIRTDSSVTIAGTYGYMPFEQFQGQAAPVSDLYSLGVTLIHLVTGESPTPDANLKIQFDASSLNPIFTSWLTWLTQLDPSQRPKDAKVALAALEGMQLVQTESKRLKPGKWNWKDDAWEHESEPGFPIKLPAKFRRLETKKVKLSVNKNVLKIHASPQETLDESILQIFGGIFLLTFIALPLTAYCIWAIMEIVKIENFNPMLLLIAIAFLYFPYRLFFGSLSLLKEALLKSSWEQLLIDRKNVTRKRGFLFFFLSETRSIDNIQELICNPGNPSDLDDSDGFVMKILPIPRVPDRTEKLIYTSKPPKLAGVSIWFPEGYAYKIEGHNLTNMDAEYLAQVLSNWLRMPINS
jgi:serine/threonine protein kinase